MRGLKGYTLTELLVVIAIVGILASIAIPIMRGRIDEAKWSEARAATGAIRRAVRAYAAEKQTDEGILGSLNDPVVALNLGFGLTDLSGAYFGQGCYSVSNVDAKTGDCMVVVNAEADPGPQGSPSFPTVMTMYPNGDWQ